MKIEQILNPSELLKLQQSGYAGKNVYVPKIQQQMSRNLIIARYKTNLINNPHIKPTVIAERTAKELDVKSLRNFYRIIRKQNPPLAIIAKPTDVNIIRKIINS